LKVRDAIRLVEQDGWRQVRQTGSHRQFKHPEKPGKVTIAGRSSEDVPIGTLKNIMKQAGLQQ
jgi:predicted RNA binding protein YcfA (HicA-like mRNA interferase family)